MNSQGKAQKGRRSRSGSGVRVVSGCYKGRLIPTAEGNPDLRPTPIRVRSATFDHLQSGLGGEAFLDLYSGSGAMGIEALSRGAGRVFMVERSRSLTRLIEDTLSSWGHEKCYEVIQDTCVNALAGLAHRGERFRYIWIDPPYQTFFEELKAVLPLTRDLLEPDGQVLIKSDKSAAPDLCNMMPSYESRITKPFGRTCVCYFYPVK